MQNLPLEIIAWVSLGFLAFAVIHSLLARSAVKEKVFNNIPAASAYYRFVYVCIALITLGLWGYYIPDMQRLLYSIDVPYHWFFYAVQLVAAIGFIQSLRNSGTQSFLGITQIRIYWKYNRLPGYLDEPSNEKLHCSGLYNYMRHPLYTFSILFMIARPTMTLRWLLLTILFSLYFWIGSYFEERELVKRFGEEYTLYRKNTPRFLPKIKKLIQMVAKLK